MANEYGFSSQVDIGQRVSAPLVKWIPAWVTPNSITLLNHVVNWLHVLAAVFAAQATGVTRAWGLVLTALLNFACMSLDCLDGMHARRTRQTSKLGEVLDHYFDALHVPMVTVSAAYALHLPSWGLLSSLCFSCAVYTAELVVHHYQHKFVNTAGPEGQLATSVLYLISAAFELSAPASAPAEAWFTLLVSSSSVVVHLTLLLSFVVRMSAREFVALCYACVVIVALPVWLYLTKRLTLAATAVLVVSLGYRIDAAYVVHSASRLRYRGMDVTLLAMLVALAASISILPDQPLFAASLARGLHLASPRQLALAAVVGLASLRGVLDLVSRLAQFRKGS